MLYLWHWAILARESTDYPNHDHFTVFRQLDHFTVFGRRFVSSDRCLGSRYICFRVFRTVSELNNPKRAYNASISTKISFAELDPYWKGIQSIPLTLHSEGVLKQHKIDSGVENVVQRRAATLLSFRIRFASSRRHQEW